MIPKQNAIFHASDGYTFPAQLVSPPKSKKLKLKIITVADFNPRGRAAVRVHDERIEGSVSEAHYKDGYWRVTLDVAGATE